MADLAARLEQTAAQDDIEIKPALRQIMTATAQLLRGSEAARATAADLAQLRKEFDEYKNRALGAAVVLGAIGGLVGELVLAFALKALHLTP
jgi:hypothetical protein